MNHTHANIEINLIFPSVITYTYLSLLKQYLVSFTHFSFSPVSYKNGSHRPLQCTNYSLWFGTEISKFKSSLFLSDNLDKMSLFSLHLSACFQVCSYIIQTFYLILPSILSKFSIKHRYGRSRILKLSFSNQE